MRAIARKLNRSPSSVCRELARNSKKDGTYSANHADKLYQKRRRNCGRRPILREGKVREYVLEKLNLRWSPEQIAWKNETGMTRFVCPHCGTVTVSKEKSRRHIQIDMYAPKGEVLQSRIEY